MLFELVGVVFGSGKSKTGSDDAFNPEYLSATQLAGCCANHLRWIIGQVQEKRDPLHASVLFKIFSKESARLQVDTHGAEHDREIVLMTVVHGFVWCVDQAGLPTDLSSNLIVRKTCGGENRDLLPSSNGIHSVDGGDTGRDHFFGVDLCILSAIYRGNRTNKAYTRVGVDGTAVDIKIVFCQNLRSLVDGSTGTIEDTAQHIFRDAKLEVVSRELHLGFLHVDARSSLKNLHDGSVASCFQHLPRSFGAIR